MMSMKFVLPLNELIVQVSLYIYNPRNYSQKDKEKNKRTILTLDFPDGMFSSGA